ncbi:CHAT domain-containing protein [Leptolyngbyaceae cyanobacterium UHCC 1019]
MQPAQTLRLAAVTLLLTAGLPLLPAPDFLLSAVAQTAPNRKAEGVGEALQEADRLLKQGNQQLETSQYQAALQSWQQALAIYQAIKDHNGEAGALMNLGLAYDSLSQPNQAIESYQQALPIFRAVQDRNGEAKTLGNLGLAYGYLSQPNKAIEFYQQALPIFRAVGDLNGEAKTLGNLGEAHRSLSQYNQAIEYHQQALPIFRAVQDRNGEALALMNLGIAYGSLSQHTKEIEYYQQALPIFRAVKDRAGEGKLLNNMGVLLKEQKQPELAIAFYKQSVNVRETIRKDLRKLSPDLQASYTESVASSYRSLADLLLQQNRVMEAMQVLDLLKVQELQDYLKDIKGNQLTAQGVSLLPQEREIVQAFDQNPAINKTISNPAVTALVGQLQQTAAAQNLTLPAYKDLQARIQKLGKNIALFYPLVLDDRLELVLFIPDRPPIRKTVNVKRTEFEREIGEFRKLLPDISALPKIRQSAQQLYTWLVQPIDAELKAAKVQTIVYAPDGQMRYVPLAALHDGTQWLTERYQINYLTALALTPIDAPDARSPTALTGALTQERTITVAGATYSFSPLSYTQAEVNQIAKMIPNTKALIDQPFNRKNLLAQMPQAAIVHLATHAKFGGTPEESFIVLGDGDVVTLREIEAWKLPNVSLFVLSACETGLGGKLGNGLEILGFGYQMQRTGSRAAIASLWAVRDDSTSELMSEFYAALQKGNSKAEALRQAQIELINSSYRHPLYWAPFILIGNGL